MGLKRRDSGQPDAKRRKRVGFTEFDIGIEANECVKIFLVSKPEEVDCAESFCISPVDLNQFFGEDGKIYGYKDLKINIWLSSRSFHAYPEISFQKSFKGTMGITDLNPVFQIMFGESLVVKKDEFLDTFSTEHNYIRDIVSNGMVIHSKVLEKHDDSLNYLSEEESPKTEHQVIRMDPSSGPVGQLYSRLVPLVLLLVEGGRPIDISDPRWDIYFAVEKESNQLGSIGIKLHGFATMYRFYHHPDSTRFRISQLLVLPPYQGHGHGSILLETINSIAIAEDVYDVTAEEPSDYLQQIRVCIDTLRLLTFEPVKSSVTSIASQLKESKLSKRVGKFWSDPPAAIIEEARKQLKINKKQFVRCWEVLIFLYLHPDDQKSMENFRTCIADRLKADILEKSPETNGKSVIDVPSDYNPQMTFVVFQAAASQVKVDGAGVNGNENNIQDDQLNQVVDKHVEEIMEIAKKVAMHAAKS
ncbi:probable histone acetyltransferase type B catalytic subunit isoform X2 [Aristolochia californica]|uniref:probable histone acetyltransferase type B catalytic subunit isoform X2 n=1 Tax=Aristolochia californica TaxID=171875 RepID=UPI0035D5CCEC